MTDLSEKECQACAGAEEPLKGSELEQFHEQLNSGWEVVDEHHLEKEYEFDDFQAAMDFAQDVGDLAEEQFHHPDITFGWGYTHVKIWTHKVGGLTEADFVFAAKAEKLLEN